MNRRLLVTGCGGFVAGSVVHEAPEKWDVHAVSRGKPLVQRKGLAWHTFDPLDAARLRDLFHAVKPDAVIHAAALADIDYCEAHKEEAWRVNAGLTEDLANLCRDAGARMLFLSTDTVFDGEKGGYVEEDPPRPLNYYAETKVAAERTVAALDVNWVVARVSLVMGLPMLGAGNSFLSRMIPVLNEGKELGVPENEIRSPIDVVTLARALLELVGNEYAGYLHLAGNDVLNRFEMVQRIAKILGYAQRLIVPRNPGNIPGRAPRPLDASLCNAKARALLHTPMLGLEAGLELVLSTRDRLAL